MTVREAIEGFEIDNVLWTVSFYISTSSGRKIFFDGWDTYNPVAWMPLFNVLKEKNNE